MTVTCARCGHEYENPRVPSQAVASAALEVCNPCDRAIRTELGMATDPDVPLSTRGVPRTRFDPLRDAPRAKSAELEPEGIPMAANDERGGRELAADLITAVRRQVAALGLSASVEGQAAITAAEKATESTGSAAAACLHELRMTMDMIRASKPSGATQDGTEDVLERMRQRKASA